MSVKEGNKQIDMILVTSEDESGWAKKTNYKIQKQQRNRMLRGEETQGFKFSRPSIPSQFPF